MTTVLEHAYAKLNLTLDVLGKRPDGYHDLQSIMQTVSLCDEVELDIGTGKPWSIVCEEPGIPLDNRNLAWKAAEVFYKATGIAENGLTIRIQKRIPSQAGMAGGSADAAAVLRGLNRHYGSPLSMDALAQLGAKVGSDVPFCVIGGTVMCEGRGELMRPVSSLPECAILICKPAFSLSTPVLFRQLDEAGIKNRPDNAAMEQALEKGDLPMVGKLLFNVFDPVVAAAYPLMDQIREMYLNAGALGCQMSGSGSAFFGIFSERNSALLLVDKLKTVCADVFLTFPV